MQCPFDAALWGNMLCSPALSNPRVRHCAVISGGIPQDRFAVVAYLIRHHECLNPPDRATPSIRIQPSLNDISFEFHHSAS